MIDNFSDVMNEWMNPRQGACTNMMEIHPDEALRRWAVQQTVTILANADYYYTKTEVDYLLKQITESAVSRQEVQRMIDAAIADKADKSQVDEIASAVSANTAAILDRYTKEEVNSLLSQYLTTLTADSMFANYSKIDGTTLELNAENIGIEI